MTTYVVDAQDWIDVRVRLTEAESRAEAAEAREREAAKVLRDLVRAWDEDGGPSVSSIVPRARALLGKRDIALDGPKGEGGGT